MSDFVTLLALQDKTYQILATRIVFFVVGVIMLGVGYYGIKTKNLLMGGKQKRLLALFGVKEITGKVAVIGGAVQLLIGLVLMVLPIVGPQLGILSTDPPAPEPRAARFNRPNFEPPRFEEPEDEYEPPGELGAPETAFAALNIDASAVGMTGSSRPPSPSMETLEETAPEGGVIVGVQLTRGAGRHDDRFSSLQFIYQVEDRYELGQLFGTEKERLYRDVARPGFVMGGVQCDFFAGDVMGLKCIYYQFQDGQIVANGERYESDVYGDDMMTRMDMQDARQPLVGVQIQRRRDRLEEIRFRFVDTEKMALLAAEAPAWQALDYPRGVALHEVPWPRKVLGGSTYEDRAPQGGVLVGLTVFVPNDSGGPIASLQPVYLTEAGYTPGPTPNVARERVSAQTVLAKPGYALAGWQFNGSGHGVKLTFMKLEKAGLLPEDSYETDWLGNGETVGRDETQPRWVSEGDLVVGLRFREAGGNIAYPTLVTPAVGDAPDVPAAPEENTVAGSNAEAAPEGDAPPVDDESPLERQWTSSSGQTITATLIAYDANAGTVTLKRGDRAPLTIPVTGLSEADQAFLRERNN